MAQQKKRILKPLTATTKQALERALRMMNSEGYACWGFVFATQDAAERLMADGQQFVVLETFNNATSVAGGNSMGEFIAKTRMALDVVMKVPHEGFDPELAKQQMLAPFEDYEKAKGTLPPKPFEKKPN